MENIIKIQWFKRYGPLEWTSILFLIGLLTMLSFQTVFAGSPGEYAVIRKDPGVKVLFKQNQLPSEYQYYYTGRSNLPYAVIGISPKYTLNSKYWYKIESQSQIIKKVKNLMPTGFTGVSYGRILDSADNQVGLWFSEYPRTIVKFGPNNSLKVFSPYRPNKYL